VPGRLALALTSTLLASAVLGGPATAAADEPPTVGIPAMAATSATSVQVSVAVDTHNTATTVNVEYVTAGAYRAHRVPGAATTVTVATLPASDAGPAVVTGLVTGLDPAATYRMRVRSSNAGGETISSDVTVATPASPKPGFTAEVGEDSTRITRLTVARGTGVETAKVICKTSAKGCPLSSTVVPLAAGTTTLSKLLKRFPLEPGAKVVVQVSAYGVRLTTLTLVVRDGQQPKVRRR
jgi:hypothetical protein